MRSLKLNKVTNLKWPATVCIFTAVLLMPVFLCGCGGKTGGDELLFQMNEEVDTQSLPDFVSEETASSMNTECEETTWIYVYVCGAVENPDVYQVAAESRLFEVIEMAGGFTEEADRAYLNLARNVTDGEQIVVYTMEETANKMTPVSENEITQSSSGLVNINRASLTELTGISGIGEGRAKAIIDYREKHGSFGSIEEIKKVDGIKDGLFSKIKDYITV
ncbi:MAG: helix-hairpin-helix domain-containing protein [Lachnospiraceae bacterium]|nr:helix-hairpin-helix domain-containing protein [Lachnospiraceae bacterium]